LRGRKFSAGGSEKDIITTVGKANSVFVCLEDSKIFRRTKG